jgi:hypothetical protein
MLFRRLMECMSSMAEDEDEVGTADDVDVVVPAEDEVGGMRTSGCC